MFSEPKDSSGALENVLAEFGAQRAAVPATERGARLGLLLAAESAGALIGAEMTHAGVPWDVAEHHRLLTEALGPRGRPPACARRAWRNWPRNCAACSMPRR